MIHHILLVDDNEMDNFIAEHLLTKEHIGEKITIKTSAKAALDYLDELHVNGQPFPEIILLDLNMPLMSGFEFLTYFSLYSKEAVKDCGVFILSSSPDTKDIHKAKRFRYVKEYFIKPLTSDKMNQIAEFGASVGSAGKKP